MIRRRWVNVVGVIGVAVVLSAVKGAWAQVGLQQHEFVAYPVASGVLDNHTARTRLAFARDLNLGDAPWIRVVFDAVTLGPGSFVRLTSALDGATQHLDAQAVVQGQFTSAYFNGGSVRLELFAGPNTTGNSIVVERLAVGTGPGPQAQSTCGTTDDRVADSHNGFARMVSLNLGGPCSGTIVSAEGCFLSAGHCLNVLGVAQFNVPPSLPNGTMQHPPPASQYVVDPASRRSFEGGWGNDWAHFECFPNSETDLTPVEAEGVFYPVATAVPPFGTLLRVTGFGADNGSADNTQQTATGPLTFQSGTQLGYRVDTQGGNSGSSVIIDATQEVVAIHTHGFCGAANDTFNGGTSITHPQLSPLLICCTPPPILQQPESIGVCAGQPATFSVEAQGADLTYQWRRNGQIIPGATDSSYTIAFVQPEHAGAYSVIVRSPCEAVSDNAILSVNPPPAIAGQPADTQTCLGDRVTLSVLPAGLGPFEFQWRLENVDIPGATAADYTIASVDSEHLGTYDCLVSDDCSTGPTNAAELSLAPTQVFVEQPQGLSIQIGESAAFFAVVSANAAFQWRKDGVDIPGATDFFWFIAQAGCADAGVYDLVTTTPCLTLASDPAPLVVLGCALPHGDHDGDGDVDLQDVAAYLQCADGPAGPAAIDCQAFDWNGDQDVDFADFGQLQRAFGTNASEPRP